MWSRSICALCGARDGSGDGAPRKRRLRRTGQERDRTHRDDDRNDDQAPHADRHRHPAPARLRLERTSNVYPGAIIQLHDGPSSRSQTAQALPLIIKGLKRCSYVTVTLAQLLAGSGT